MPSERVAKVQARRAKVWDMYTNQHMTMRAISEALGMQWTTVANDIMVVRHRKEPTPAPPSGRAIARDLILDGSYTVQEIAEMAGITVESVYSYLVSFRRVEPELFSKPLKTSKTGLSAKRQPIADRRAIVLAHHYEGKTNKAIAEELGLPYSTVANDLWTAKHNYAGKNRGLELVEVEPTPDGWRQYEMKPTKANADYIISQQEASQNSPAESPTAVKLEWGE